ncbi:hypothetical protein E5F92_013530 [Flavobacterium columnare]|uniref:Prolyl-tRNA synthetase n=1 Tax=Flavobacterium columnare TaxID=996 RepID=A0AA94JR22_9FLAO|nr:hypothetical protein [Flavobacterium columnare]MCH4833668.1 hypothetical protein [Flavobacterium columnare]
MKTNFQYLRNAVVKIVLVSISILIQACASYQNISYYDNDGIYGSTHKETKIIQEVRDQNNDGGRYKEYFGAKANDFKISNKEVFTDIASYTSTLDTTKIVSRKNYEGWGGNNKEVTVNVYNNSWNHWGWSYGTWWNHWGYRPYYSGFSYWNDWYYSPHWGYTYYGPYWGSGWYDPYYTNTYYGWNNSYYYGRNYSYSGERRLGGYDGGSYLNYSNSFLNFDRTTDVLYKRNYNTNPYYIGSRRNGGDTQDYITNTRSRNYESSPRSYETPRNYESSPRSYETPRNYESSPRSYETPRNYESSPRSYETPRNYESSPRSYETPRNYESSPRSYETPRNYESSPRSYEAPRNYESSPRSYEAPRNYESSPRFYNNGGRR